MQVYLASESTDRRRWNLESRGAEQVTYKKFFNRCKRVLDRYERTWIEETHDDDDDDGFSDSSKRQRKKRLTSSDSNDVETAYKACSGHGRNQSMMALLIKPSRRWSSSISSGFETNDPTWEISTTCPQGITSGWHAKNDVQVHRTFRHEILPDAFLRWTGTVLHRFLSDLRRAASSVMECSSKGRGSDLRFRELRHVLHRRIEQAPYQ